MKNAFIYTLSAGSVYVSGRTYDHKDILKGLGAKWSQEQKAWCFLNESDVDSVRARIQERIEVLCPLPAPRASLAPQPLLQSPSIYRCCDKCKVLDAKKRITWCDVHCVDHGDGRKDCMRVNGCIYTGD